MNIWMATGPGTTRLNSATAERISQAVRSRRREPAAPSDQAVEIAFELGATGPPGSRAAPPRRRSTYRSSLRRPSCRGRRAQSSATAESQATVDGSAPAPGRGAPRCRRSRSRRDGPPCRPGGSRNRPASGALGLPSPQERRSPPAGGRWQGRAHLAAQCPVVSPATGRGPRKPRDRPCRAPSGPVTAPRAVRRLAGGPGQGAAAGPKRFQGPPSAEAMRTLAAGMVCRRPGAPAAWRLSADPWASSPETLRRRIATSQTGARSATPQVGRPRGPRPPRPESPARG
jgi:hypothetical protein